MKLDKISIDGKKDSIEVLDKIFLAKVNNKLVSSVLYKANANYKGRHAKTKQQNEVRGPTSKIYAQKGTGGANKKNLKKNIEKIFKVNVTKINIINKQNRTKLTRGKKVKVSGYKKAIITLKKGQSIDLTTGV